MSWVVRKKVRRSKKHKKNSKYERTSNQKIVKLKGLKISKRSKGDRNHGRK